MSSDRPESAPTVTFPVSYQNTSGASNADFSGHGTLSIHAEEPVYRFTGDSAGWRSKPRSLNFRSDEIWNVASGGHYLQFETSLGRSAAKGRPFGFLAESQEDAHAIACLLPRAADADFKTRLDFQQQLARLSSASSRWTTVTLLLIATNLAVFVIMGFLGAGWITTESMSPYILYVANNAGATTDGEWWRLVTCMFVHYGLLHLALNMWALYQTGHFVEKILGRPLFLLAYLGSGLVASFTSLLWNGDQVWSAGASGAVFGVFGMIIGFMLREKRSIPAAIVKPMMRSALTFAGYNLIYGMIVPQIDNAAHIGGLAGGFVLGWLVAMPLEPEVRTRIWRRQFLIGVGAITLLSAVGVAVSPRYEYHFREEIRWDESSRKHGVEELTLLQQEHDRLSAYQISRKTEPVLAWLETSSIPFYEKWLAEVDALDLTPGKITEQRRRFIAGFLRGKIANHRQLASDLRAGDEDPLPRYLAQDRLLANQPETPRR